MSEIMDAIVGGANEGIINTTMSGMQNLAEKQKPKPMAMPVVDDVQSKVSRRKSLIKQMSRRGRASTILTNDETLG